MTTRMRRFPTPTVTLPAMALALSLAMAGCSGDDDDKEGDGEAGATETPSESATPNTTSPPDLPTPPEPKKFEGAVADVVWDASACATEPGEQTVEGTVTNPTKNPADYVITISWINATSDVLGLGYATVQGAEPDEEVDWDLTGDVADGAEQCVINVKRGDLKKNQD